MAAAHKWYAKEPWLAHEGLFPPRVGVSGVRETELEKPPSLPVDQRRDPELGRESAQLTRRGASHGEVDEVGFHVPFREKPECLACSGTLSRAEDLRFDILAAVFYQRSHPPRLRAWPRPSDLHAVGCLRSTAPPAPPAPTDPRTGAPAQARGWLRATLGD